MRLEVPERCRLLDRVGAERRRSHCAAHRPARRRGPDRSRGPESAAAAPASRGGAAAGAVRRRPAHRPRSFCASPMIRGRRLITPAAPRAAGHAPPPARCPPRSPAQRLPADRPRRSAPARKGSPGALKSEPWPRLTHSKVRTILRLKFAGRKAGELIIRTRDRLSARRNRRRNVRPGPSRFAAARTLRATDSGVNLKIIRIERAVSAGACQVEAMSDFPAYNLKSTDTDGLAGHGLERPGTLNGAFWAFIASTADRVRRGGAVFGNKDVLVDTRWSSDRQNGGQLTDAQIDQAVNVGMIVAVAHSPW